MFKRQLSALESRKRLLIAESDLNRSLLAQEYHALSEGLETYINPVRRVGDWFSKAASFVTLFKLLRPKAQSDGEAHSSWFSRRLLRLGAALWVGLRANRN